VRKPSQQTREQIVASARRLFNRHGFDAVSIDAIMAGAGLTRGAFYTYFASKSDLYADVLTCFFNTPNAPNNWGGVHLDLDAPDARDQIIRAYLSRQHADAVETACPMVALPSDVARGGSSAKQAFERAFTAMINCLEDVGARVSVPTARVRWRWLPCASVAWSPHEPSTIARLRTNCEMRVPRRRSGLNGGRIRKSESHA